MKEKREKDPPCLHTHAALEAGLVEKLVHVLEERPVLPPVQP